MAEADLLHLWEALKEEVEVGKQAEHVRAILDAIRAWFSLSTRQIRNKLSTLKRATADSL